MRLANVRGWLPTLCTASSLTWSAETGDRIGAGSAAYLRGPGRSGLAGSIAQSPSTYLRPANHMVGTVGGIGELVAVTSTTSEWRGDGSEEEPRDRLSHGEAAR
jgi:hypothetical protein